MVSTDSVFDGVRARVEDMGYELVDFRKSPAGRRQRLQVRIDRPDSAPGRGVTVGDCEAVSRELEPWLDQSGLLGANYVLEVSSPGIERPIRWRSNWLRFVGHDVKVKLPGRGRVKASIERVAGEDVVLLPEGDESTVTVPIDDSLQATLAVDWNEIEGKGDLRENR